MEHVPHKQFCFVQTEHEGFQGAPPPAPRKRVRDGDCRTPAGGWLLSVTDCSQAMCPDFDVEDTVPRIC